MKKLLLLLMFVVVGMSANAQKRYDYDKITALKDFAEEADKMREKKMPMLVIFSSPYCIYCEKIIHNHIPKLEKDPRFAGKVLFRNVDFDNPQSMMVDEEGEFVTIKEYSDKYDVTYFPEIIFLDADGKELSKKIQGYDGDVETAKLLENALLESMKKLGAS